MKGTILTVVGYLSVLGSSRPSVEVIDLPSTTHNGTVEAQLVSQPGGLGSFDGQKLAPFPNRTSFDWWYFDVVSTSSINESFVAVFNEAGEDSLTSPGRGGTLMSIAGTFKNGTKYMSNVRAEDGATITMGEHLIQGKWKHPNWTMQFEGHRGQSSLLPRYEVQINSPEDDIYGTFTLQSIAPPRYPCSPESIGATMEVAPYFGWANIIPDAKATVDLMVKGEHVSFSGVGYHDKNWSERSFTQLIKFWYWGHARIGPYSIVWFDLRAAGADTQHQSGYIAKNGKIIHVGCLDGVSSVRPWGNASEYPPSVSNKGPSGITIIFDMGNKGIFQANITNSLVALDAGTYQRHTGKARGGIVGGRVHEGVSFFEIMHLA